MLCLIYLTQYLEEQILENKYEDYIIDLYFLAKIHFCVKSVRKNLCIFVSQNMFIWKDTAEIAFISVKKNRRKLGGLVFC